MRELITAICFLQPLLLCMAGTAFCQDYESQLLAEIQRAYEQLNYVEAEIKAKAALKEYERFGPHQLTEIHKILGIIYFSQNEAEEAQQHFERALSINENLQLDPVFVSPKILEFFEQIKGKLRANQRDDIRAKPEVRYVLLEDRRPAAALRSMIMPGWGQFYKGENKKGLMLSALWGVGITGVVAFQVARANAEDKYLAETDPDKIESRFDKFERFHQLRNGFLLFSAGVWLYSYLDAFLKPRTAPTAKTSVSILPSVSRQRTNLTIQIRF